MSTLRSEENKAVDSQPTVRHTRGPWRIDGNQDGGHYRYISASDWGCFARVVVQISGDRALSPEGLANARLIAAAPEMLAALKEAYTHIFDSGSDITMAPVIEQIGRAIDKAEGR